MKAGAVDPLNGRHFNAPGYLNSWQRMCWWCIQQKSRSFLTSAQNTQRKARTM